MANRKRILYIEKILRECTDENHSLTGREIEAILKERYNIAPYRSTIADDVAALIESGMDIQIERSVQNRYRFVGRDFDKAELKLIIDAVNASKFITKSKSRELVQKISSLAGPDQKGLVRHGDVEDRARNGNKKLFLIIDAIFEAIEAKKQISFYYFRYNEKKERILQHKGAPYLFNPFFLVWNGEYYYMVGSYANHPEIIATFRVDRISEPPVILDKKRHAAPTGFKADQYLNSRFHMFGSADQSPQEVTLLCENDVANGIIDRFGTDIDMKVYDDRRFTVMVSIVPTSVFLGWVFGFGGKVRIMGPEEVVDMSFKMMELIRKGM